MRIQDIDEFKTNYLYKFKAILDEGETKNHHFISKAVGGGTFQDVVHLSEISNRTIGTQWGVIESSIFNQYYIEEIGDKGQCPEYFL